MDMVLGHLRVAPGSGTYALFQTRIKFEQVVMNEERNLDFFGASCFREDGTYGGDGHGKNIYPIQGRFLLQTKMKIRESAFLDFPRRSTTFYVQTLECLALLVKMIPVHSCTLPVAAVFPCPKLHTPRRPVIFLRNE